MKALTAVKTVLCAGVWSFSSLLDYPLGANSPILGLETRFCAYVRLLQRV